MPVPADSRGTDFETTVQIAFEELKMATGNVKWFNTAKGFGFIATEEGGKDLFFHRSACTDSFEDLREGDTVEYTPAQGPKGPCAENVKSA